MIYAVLWPDLIKGMENDVASVFAGAIKLGFLVYLIHLCLIADWKRVVEKVARFWHPLVLGIFIWLFIGDAIRKLVPTGPWQMMLVLDIMVFFAYTLFVIDRVIKKKSLWRPWFLVSIAVFGIVFLANLLGPYSAGLGAGLVGFRS